MIQPGEESGAEPRQIRSGGRQSLLWVFFSLFVVLTCVSAYHHEPWRDEGDVWLAVRDDSAGGIIFRAAHAGTPVLWYMILKPFADLGFGYYSAVAVHLVIAALSAFVVLFRAPFPLVLRGALVFTYFFSFEYAVITRNYAIGVFLLLLVACTYRRPDRRVLTGLLLALVVNTSVHALVIGTVLIAGFLVRLGRERREDRSVGLAPILLPVIGWFLAYLQLYPRQGGQLSPEIIRTASPEALVWALRGMIVPGTSAHLVGSEAVSAFLLIATAVVMKPVSLRLMYLASVSGLLALFVFGYAVPDGFRHFGFLWLVMVLFLWWYSDGRERGRKAAGAVIVGASIVPLLVSAVNAHRNEIRFPFSGSRETARFLNETERSSAPMAVYPGVLAGGLLPQLERADPVYYPAEERFGSFALWDESHIRAGDVQPKVAIRRAKAVLGRSSAFLFVTNSELSVRCLSGFNLLFASEPQKWGRQDERFFVYELEPLRAGNRPDAPLEPPSSGTPAPP